jgi:SAM-dependent methyltransferase
MGKNRRSARGVMSSGALESPEKRFYDRRHPGEPSSAIVDYDLRRKGSRYYGILDSISAPGLLSAVEWGFGDPSCAAALNRVFGSYIALDISAERIAAEDVPFRVMAHNLNYDLPFPDEAFDVSIAMMVIEHLFNPFHSFREIARTTKRGGHVFINLPMLTSIKNRARLAVGRLPVTSSKNWWQLEEWDGGHLHYFTIPTVRRLGEKYGLLMTRLYPVGQVLWLKEIWPAMFCDELSFLFRRSNQDPRAAQDPTNSPIK